MKQYLLNICILFVCITGTLLLPQRSFGQLSGAYTINPTKAASSTNYKNWASAVGDLTSGTRTDGGTAKGPGVSAAVTFSVYDTIYATNVLITSITGASRTNSITFKSTKGDSIKCKIQYPSSSTSSDDYALLLDGADFITFQQIGFERTGSNTYSTVVQITNDADNNKFIRCQMTGYKMPSNNTLGFAYGIGSCIYFTGNGDSTEITQNRLLYGYNGIYNLTAAAGNKITKNRIDTSGSSGAYVASQTNFKFTGNTVSMGDFGSNSGQYTCYGIRIESSPSLEISKNKFYLLANNASVARAVLLITTVSTASAPSKVYNNWVFSSAGTANCTGLTTYGCDYINYYYNNVLITNSMSDGCAYFHNASYANTYIRLLNNNLINKGGGLTMNVPGSNTSDFDSVNYNNLYTSGTTLGNWGGTNVTSFSSWQTTSGKDANSMNVDPAYISNNNMHIANYVLKGKGLTNNNVKDDIDGDIRDNPPTIGADELLPVPNDAGIVAMTQPAASTCGATLSVAAVIKNYGTAALKKATINWSVNGIVQTAYSWTGNLSTNKQDTVVIGNFNFTTILNPKMVIKTSLPNGSADGIPFNDSILLVRALRGPPTANAGADFAICLGDSSLIGPTNNPTNSYKWFNSSNTLIATTAQITVKPSTKTTYMIEVKSNSFGCTARDTIVVDVNPKPVADAGSDFAICPGGSVQIGKAAQNGFSYSWTSNPSGYTSSTATPTVSPSATTTYILVKTITATGCKASDQMVVTVNKLPTPSVFGTSTVCIGEQLNYTTTSASGSTYQWTLKGGKLLSGQNTNTIKVQWNVADTGNIKVVETNSSTCKDSSTLKVVVIGKPTASFLAADVCKGTISTFVNTSTDALTNAWTFGDGGVSTQPNPTHLYVTATIFNVQLIVRNGYNCADTAHDVAVVNPIPVANFGITKTAEKTFDFSDSSTITIGSITGWHWVFGDGDSALIKNPSHVFAAGNFDVKLCVTSFAGCKNCVTKNLNVVGLNHSTFNNQLTVFPNPGSGVFNFTSAYNAESVTITNINGQIIKTIYPADKNFRIDLSGEAEGVYFAKVKSGNISSNLKLMKQ